MLCHFLGRIRFVTRLRRIPFLGYIKSLHCLRNIHDLVKERSNYNRRSKTFSFRLNSTSFHSKLNGKWSAVFKTSSENVKLMACGLVSRATGTAVGVTALCSALHRLNTK